MSSYNPNPKSKSTCCQYPQNKSTIVRADPKGKNEVPPNASSATGRLVGLLSPNESRLDFALQTEGLINITAAHFHDGPKGVNGPVIKNINIDASTGAAIGSWTTTDLIQPLTPAIVSKLKSCGIYINVHTATFPGGEIRAQVYLCCAK